MENLATQALINSNADIVDDCGECIYLGWFLPGTWKDDENNCCIIRLQEIDGVTERLYAEGFEQSIRKLTWKKRHLYKYENKKYSH